MLCRRCVLSWLETVEYFSKRGVSTVKARRKREEKKDVIFQYVREGAKPVESTYIWGCTTTGALGNAIYLKPSRVHPLKRMFRPDRLKFFDNHHMKVLDVACGYGITLFLVKYQDSVSLFGTGINTSSQLGFHDVSRSTGRGLDYIIEPVKIKLPLNNTSKTKVIQAACGRAHTLVLTDKEGVFSLGNNAYGQCGRPIVEGEIYSQSHQIHKIEDLPDNIKQVVCGQDHSLFLTDTGEVYSCGLGADGQTGLGHYDSEYRPTLLKGDLVGVRIKQIGGIADCVLAVSEEGEVFGWGNSEYDQLGTITDLTQVNTPKHLPFKKRCGKIHKAIAGGSSCAVLTESGRVYVWGYGILGKGPQLESAQTPQCIPPTLFGMIPNDPSNKFADHKVVDIACGIGHFLALTKCGNLYSWGKCRSGCLGLGKDTDQFFPLRVSMPVQTYAIRSGVDHSVALCRAFV